MRGVGAVSLYSLNVNIKMLAGPMWGSCWPAVCRKLYQEMAQVFK